MAQGKDFSRRGDPGHAAVDPAYVPRVVAGQVSIELHQFIGGISDPNIYAEERPMSSTAGKPQVLQYNYTGDHTDQTSCRFRRSRRVLA
jgi:hypothetical protein